MLLQFFVFLTNRIFFQFQYEIHILICMATGLPFKTPADRKEPFPGLLSQNWIMQKYETHDVLVAQPLARASLGVIFHHGKPSIFYVSLLTREE